MTEDMAELIEIGDLDELLRATDRLCDAREWAALVELRDRCRKAVERGKQLWPAANHPVPSGLLEDTSPEGKSKPAPPPWGLLRALAEPEPPVRRSANASGERVKRTPPPKTRDPDCFLDPLG